jgi:SAM-dependent methyltransferase
MGKWLLMATDWTGMASAYDTSFARLCSGTIPVMIQRIRAAHDDGMGLDGMGLDVGAGTGALASALSASGFAVWGVDADEGMVAFAHTAHPELQFTVGALPSLEFPDGQFDFVVANFVVNHVARPREAVQELARVAAKGGLVIATIWPSAPVSPLNRLWNQVVDRSGADRPAGTRLPLEDDFERSRNGLGDLFMNAGLTGVNVDEVSWDFTISAGDLWRAVEAGIANIGAIYRHQDEAGQRAMRAEYEELTRSGGLVFQATALIAVGSAV